MAELDDVISISEISEKIIERISDKKLLQLHTDDFWKSLNLIHPSFWRRRIHENYPNSLLLEKLLDDFKIGSFDDYCSFVTEYLNIKRFSSKFTLETFETEKRTDGPGTAPTSQDRTKLSSNYRTICFPSTGIIEMKNLKTGDSKSVRTQHTKIIFIRDQMIGYDAHQHTISESFFISLFDEEGAVIDSALPAESVFSMTIYPTNNPDRLLVTTTIPGDEDDSSIVEIYFLTVESQKLKLESIFKETFDLTVFTAYYAQDEKIMCFSHRFDSNNWDVSIIDSTISTATVLERSVFQKTCPLTSDLLNDGFACWPPVQMTTSQFWSF
ncbi:unnamed protein product [Oikopleura dioica]|uniref:Uncharacterized protein n=1 Tax=Oikopleura dioica TaxID=34765 RepID=E4X7H5_OIKDI|nr:unnamed protein product [Oikopleura dioica]